MIFSRELFFKHVMGVSCLAAWYTRIESSYKDIAIRGPVIELGMIPSQRFCLGYSGMRSLGPHPFLCVQDQEEEFIARIQWKNAWIDLEKCRLVLVSEKMMGDAELVPDIPAFSFGILFDDAEKLEALKSYNRLTARPLWFEDGDAHVSGGKPFFDMPLKVLSSSQSSYFEKNAISQTRSLLEISKLREAKLSERVAGLQFQGEEIQVLDDSLSFLTKPFDANEIEKVR